MRGSYPCLSIINNSNKNNNNNNNDDDDDDDDDDDNDNSKDNDNETNRKLKEKEFWRGYLKLEGVFTLVPSEHQMWTLPNTVQRVNLGPIFTFQYTSVLRSERKIRLVSVNVQI